MVKYGTSMLTAYHGETDRIIHINDITKHTTGQKLGKTLVCMDCGAQVQARIERYNPYRKKKQSRHFSHVSSAVSCIHQGETYLHLRAKEIIKESMCLSVPRLTYDVELPAMNRQDIYHDPLRMFEPKLNDPSFMTLQQLIQQEMTMVFQDVVLEYHTDEHSFIPDCYATTVDNQKIYIEIYVTHSVDEAKRNELFEQGISTIEIDLSDPVYRDVNHPGWENMVKYAVIQETKHKKWLYHTGMSSARKQLKTKYLTHVHDMKRKIIAAAYDKALREDKIQTSAKIQRLKDKKYLDDVQQLIEQASLSLCYVTYLSAEHIINENVSSNNNQINDYLDKLSVLESNIIDKFIDDAMLGTRGMFDNYPYHALESFDRKLMPKLIKTGKIDSYTLEFINQQTIIRKNTLITLEKEDPANNERIKDILASYGIKHDLSW